MTPPPIPPDALAVARGGPLTPSGGSGAPSTALVLPGGSCGFLATRDGGRFYCPRCGGFHGQNPDRQGQRLHRRMAVYHDPNVEGVVVLACWDCHFVERRSLASVPEGTIFDALPGEAMQEWLREHAPPPPPGATSVADLPPGKAELPAPEGARRLLPGSTREVVDEQ